MSLEDKMMKKYQKVLKTVLFCIGLALMIAGMQRVFSTTDSRIYQTVKGFYKEPNDSLDAVYIGGSNVYAYWQGALAWNDCGIAVYPLSVPSMPAHAFKYLIEEARKTQPDALYIINLNEYKNPRVTVQNMHYLVDFMPFSMSKIRMINDLSGVADITGFSKLEYYFPIIRFHSGWSELESGSFEYSLNGLKGAANYNTFLKSIGDVSSLYLQSSERLDLTDLQKNLVDDLLSYCEENQVKVLFVVVPQAIEDETTLAQLNKVADYVDEKGFDVLNLQSSVSEIGIDVTTDYYNWLHTNLHGSIKYTDYLSRYLTEHYDFEDKRGDQNYSHWDNAYTKYLEIISPYSTDFERAHSERDYSLSSPLVTTTVTGQSVNISWNKIDGVEGYYIYRRYTNPETNTLTPWEFIGSVDDADITFYTDIGLGLDVKYNYTVVPVRMDGDSVVYGKFNMEGVNATTIMVPPALGSLQETEKGITINWEPVEGADGYAIYRMVNGQEWDCIADVGQALSYTDQSYQREYPYLYSVGAYQTVDGTVKYGYYNPIGLLRMADLEAPVLDGNFMDDGSYRISWNAIKGADNYYVYKKTADEEWELAIVLSKADTSYTDYEFQEGVKYSYKVASVLRYGQDVYEFMSNEIELEEGDK